MYLHTLSVLDLRLPAIRKHYRIGANAGSRGAAGGWRPVDSRLAEVSVSSKHLLTSMNAHRPRTYVHKRHCWKKQNL